ncbi:hypothetical protein VP01_15417g1, partial [Puccinia sorghi]
PSLFSLKAGIFRALRLHCIKCSPVLFVPKKDGSLRLCFDYRKLNNVTRKNAYTVPPMSHLLTLFHGATLFLKLDLRGVYNLI